jgi:uncharacterized protein YecA (UPF0149 family)
MKIKILIILIFLVGLSIGGFFIYESILQPKPEREVEEEAAPMTEEEPAEKPEGEQKLNIIEKTNLSEKDLTYLSFDVSSYQAFINNNMRYSKPISEDEIYRQINQSREYLKNYPEGKFAENLRGKIIQELNM